MPVAPPPPEAFRGLDPAILAWIESLTTRLDAALARVQQLEDEVARLKKVPLKPAAARPQPPPRTDHSSEKDRCDPKPRAGREKDPPIDRTVPVALPEHSKPPNARFHGYERTTVQELRIERDNVCFVRER